jgi:hypothetical protein
MARLQENSETLARIKDKATRNAMQLNTSGKKASFSLGKTVVSFGERCEIYRHLGVPARV